MKILTKLYTLFKLLLKSKVDREVDHDKIFRKINKLTKIIQLYLNGIDDINEEELLMSSKQYIQESVPEISGAVNEWLLITKKENNI
jgi:hypothetical protein